MATKRSRRALVLFPALVLAFLPALAPAACGLPFRGARTDTLLVLHTNDLHARLAPHPDGMGGLARIAGYADRERAVRADVLLLDAGDAVTGSAVSTLYRGRPVFAVMSLAGYDAGTLGNHEFDHGFGLVADYRRIASFPILCANATGPGGGLLADAPFAILDADGVRVGVVGVTTPETPALTASGSTTGCRFGDPAAAVREALAGIGDRADLILVLSHLGHEADLALAAAVPEIDVIVGGHSHAEVPEPVRAGSTLVVQAGSGGRCLGRLELLVDLGRGEVLRHEGALIPVDDSFPCSAQVAALVSTWEDRAAARVGGFVGSSGRDLDREDLRRAIEAVFRERLGTDLGYMNPGGVRTTILAGEIRETDLFAVLPFDNSLTVVGVRGRDLPGELARRIGRPDPDRVYTVGTNSFVSAHPEQYFPGGFVSVEDSGLEMRDAFIDAVRRAGGIEPLLALPR